MAWEWSHASEAYEKAEKNLRRKSLKWLAEAYAEWKCYDIDKEADAFEINFEQMGTALCNEGYYTRVEANKYIPESMTSNPLTDGRYDFIALEARNDVKERIADYVWKRASEQRTCENGGFNPWMCPHGCHTVEW